MTPEFRQCLEKHRIVEFERGGRLSLELLKKGGGQSDTGGGELPGCCKENTGHGISLFEPAKALT